MRREIKAEETIAQISFIPLWKLIEMAREAGNKTVKKFKLLKLFNSIFSSDLHSDS